MTESTNPFQSYAATYDGLYQEKEYSSECSFLEKALKRFDNSRPTRTILDLGCGTGGHAILLAERGYQVHGVDISQSMLDLAQVKAAKSKVKDSLSWTLGNMQTVQLHKQFDVVISMFAVMSYQTTNEELIASFKTAASHLRSHGLFVCDFWYGPAVIKDPPVVRQKEVQATGKTIHRKAVPSIDYNTNVVKIHYDLQTTADNGETSRFEETHHMRYLFLPELRLMAEIAGLEFVHASKCCEIDAPSNETTWTASAIFRKKL